jgi:hypothetical protein
LVQQAKIARQIVRLTEYINDQSSQQYSINCERKKSDCANKAHKELDADVGNNSGNQQRH